MSLSEDERQTLVLLELQKAEQTLEEIDILSQANHWNGAANRLYYAVFHAVNALLIHDGHEAHTHRRSHAIFGMHNIKTGVFPKEYGRHYSTLQTMREESDYNCVYNVTQQEIEDGIEPAKQFIAAIQKYVSKP